MRLRYTGVFLKIQYWAARTLNKWLLFPSLTHTLFFHWVCEQKYTLPNALHVVGPERQEWNEECKMIHIIIINNLFDFFLVSSPNCVFVSSWMFCTLNGLKHYISLIKKTKKKTRHWFFFLLFHSIRNIVCVWEMTIIILTILQDKISNGTVQNIPQVQWLGLKHLPMNYSLPRVLLFILVTSLHSPSLLGVRSLSDVTVWSGQIQQFFCWFFVVMMTGRSVWPPVEVGKKRRRKWLNPEYKHIHFSDCFRIMHHLRCLSPRCGWCGCPG